MTQRARKYREIKKRVKALMKDLLKENSDKESEIIESYLDVICQRNDDFYQLIENNENVDDSNCHLDEDNVNNLRNNDIVNDYEDFDNSFDNNSVSSSVSYNSVSENATSSESNESVSQNDNDTSLKNKIQKWCVQEGIKHSSINKLLNIFEKTYK